MEFGNLGIVVSYYLLFPFFLIPKIPQIPKIPVHKWNSLYNSCQHCKTNEISINEPNQTKAR